MQEYKKLSLDYNILSSNSDDNPPLLLILHGYGANKDDLFSFADQLNPKYLRIAVQAPHEVMMPGVRAWYNLYQTPQGFGADNEQAKESMGLLLTFIDELKSEFGVSEVNLLGFSQGAILSYALALANPKIFNKILALSGYLEKELINLSDDKEAIDNLDIFITHGKYDDVITYDKASTSYAILDQNNIKYDAKSYDMAHGINQDCLFDIINKLND